MPVNVKLGKRPARYDPAVPRMSIFTRGRLPPPPAYSNWYADISDWGMLMNDTWGDCFEAAILHWIMEQSAYAGKPLVATNAEVLAFYSYTGFDPNDPSTDQGTYGMGRGGAFDFWKVHGVMCGGQLDKVTAYMQIMRKDPIEWMQGINYFGGMLVGLQLPEAILAANTVPDVWYDYNGPVAGGHEILVNGYQTVGSTRLYDLISWGAHYRATEDFLMHCVDETVVVVDPIMINAQGLDAAGFSFAELQNYMRLLARKRAVV
jgi:hypothetical protein